MILIVLLSSVYSALALDSVGLAIDQARELILRRSRKEACELLTRHVDASTSLKVKQKLSGERTKLAQVFFSDRGQKSFEAGRGLLHSNPEMAQSNFEKSMELEDGNTLVARGLMRVAILRGQCERARSYLADAIKLDSADPELHLFELKLLSCARKFDEFNQRLKDYKFTSREHQSFVDYLSGLNSHLEGRNRIAVEKLAKFMADHPQFPEAYYWGYKASIVLLRPNKDWAQKYLKICSALTDKERNLILQEPEVCSHLKEVESELAKTLRDE